MGRQATAAPVLFPQEAAAFIRKTRRLSAAIPGIGSFGAKYRKW